MKSVLRTLAYLMVVVGGIWLLQGLNVLPGSFMTGQTRWAVYGAVLAAAGGVLLALTRRRVE